MASAANQALAVVARENATSKEALAWAGLSVAGNAFAPVKVLDGYPVRGDVSLILRAIGSPIATPDGPQMWGFFYAVGAGRIQEDERRFIGVPLTGFGKGLGFPLSTQPSILPAEAGPAPLDSIIHVFEPNRVDEMSLGFTPFVVPPVPGTLFRLTFEKIDNTPVIPGHAVNLLALSAYGPGGVLPASGGYPPSPYLFHNIPFGGGGQPLLHHIRASVVGGVADEPGALFAHGYFVRK
jgi:hypothetical protein